jgi:predicted sulfurtransferase
MLHHELNRGSCKTYLIGCESTRRAALGAREMRDLTGARTVMHQRAPGVRSATAAAVLRGLGFEHVCNLKGGMLDWNEAGLPVER